MLEKFSFGLFLVICGVVMNQGKGLGCAQGRGRSWERWKGPQTGLLLPSRTGLTFIQKEKGGDLI